MLLFLVGYDVLGVPRANDSVYLYGYKLRERFYLKAPPWGSWHGKTYSI